MRQYQASSGYHRPWPSTYSNQLFPVRSITAYKQLFTAQQNTEHLQLFSELFNTSYATNYKSAVVIRRRLRHSREILFSQSGGDAPLLRVSISFSSFATSVSSWALLHCTVLCFLVNSLVLRVALFVSQMTSAGKTVSNYDVFFRCSVFMTLFWLLSCENTQTKLHLSPDLCMLTQELHCT